MMQQCSPCERGVWEAAAEGQEVKRVCSAAGTAAGPCQLPYELHQDCWWPASSLAAAFGTLLRLPLVLPGARRIGRHVP